MKKWIQQSAASLALATMVLSPVAQGAAAKRSLNDYVSNYLKQTGLTTKQMTVGEFWKMVRHVYPKDLQAKMDIWVKANEKMPMPKISASSYKDGDNKQYVRMLLTQGKESHTLTVSENEAKKLSLDDVSFTESELLKRKNILEKADSVIYKKKSSQLDKRVLSTREIARLPLKKQLDYMLKLRQASEAADAVLAKSANRKGAAIEAETGALYAGEFSGLLKTLLGEEAFAKTWADGNSCIAAGWVATYKDGSCARPREGRQSLISAIDGLPFNDSIKGQATKCASGGGLPCNPILFGFGEGTKVHCVGKSNVKYATRECNQKFPLKNTQDKEKIINSIVKANGGKSLCTIENDGKTVPQNCMSDLGSYITDLKAHYRNASEFCTVKGSASTTAASSWVTRSDLREDQMDACENLKDRYFDLMVKAGDIPGPVPGEGELPGPSVENCAKENKNFDPETETCICPDGQKDPKDPNKCLPTKDDDGGAGVPVKNDGPNWWDRNKGWVIPVGIGLIGLGLFWYLSKKENDAVSTTYTPPTPPPLPPTPVCDSGQVLKDGVCTNPVVTPPANPCPAPNQMVNGVCVPPVVVDPPAVPSEGGSGTTNDGSAGGVR